MISIIKQPAAWIAAYDSNRFEFQYSQNVGLFDITDSIDGANRVISAGSLVGLFYVNQYVSFTVSMIPYFSKVKAVDTVTGIVTLELVAGLSSIPNVPVVIYWDEPVEVILQVGNLVTGRPFTEVARMRVVCRASVYAIDVLGYLQEYFTNIQAPPVLGIDEELFCHYRLLLNDGGLFEIGQIKNCAYSTLVGLNSSPYVATAGTPLRIGPVETFSSPLSLYSRIIGNYIENLTI